MTYSDYQTLLFSRAGAVLTVTLNRPRAYNAVHGVLHRELSRVFPRVASAR
jgi:enoyl-CoA hydratase/carnithine racemase